MTKKIVVFFVGILILFIGYLLGVYRLDKKFVPANQNKQVVNKTLTTITPTPTVDIVNFISTNDAGLITYKDVVTGISFQYAQDLTIYGSPCNIQMEKYDQIPHGSTTSYLQIAIISKLKPISCNWTAYQGQEHNYQLLSQLDVGGKVSTSDTNPEFFTYTRLPDQMLGKNKFKHFISYKVWESSVNTVNHVYMFESKKYTVWVMGLTNEDLMSGSAISYKAFEDVVSTLSIN